MQFRLRQGKPAQTLSQKLALLMHVPALGTRSNSFQACKLIFLEEWTMSKAKTGPCSAYVREIQTYVKPNHERRCSGYST